MYTPFYIKTNNSLLGSMIKIEELIQKAIDEDIKSLTITDNNMYGAYDFYKACKKNNIKPIIGLEINFTTNFVLYATSYTGYKNLIKLSTIQSERMIKATELNSLRKDLICIVPYNSMHFYDNLAKIYTNIYAGYSNLEEKNALNVESVYIDEILYLEPNDEEYYKYLVAMKEGILTTKVVDYPKNKYLRPFTEIQELFPYDLENNRIITEMCNLEIMPDKDLLPIFDCPNNLDSFGYLKELCKEGLKNKFGISAPKKYVERLKHELNTINEMGFCDYFLIVADYVKYAKENNFLVGPGRGSAAGSLVSYILDIITIDPIEYNLLFERFLNPERISMPDIDIDFEDGARDAVIKYCIEKYGEKKVVPIIAFGTLGAKQALRDVAKTMDIEQPTIDNVCKMIDSNKTLTENLMNQKLSNLLSINDELNKMYKIAIKFEGNKRQTTIHAAGVIMSRVDIDEVIPLDKSHKDFYTTGYSMEYLEELGLLKMDFLVVRTLNTISSIIADINEDTIELLTFDNITLNDEKAINIFTNANTTGIFQFESVGMMNFLRNFKPTNFEDICAAMALFRPGPMQNIDSYIARKHGKEKIDYFHPLLKEILEPTYGIIVYQEQIMQIANVMAGYTLGEADVLRRAMSKKKGAILVEETEKFITRCVENGFEEELAEKVYKLILKFAEYGFNRSHSVAYAHISYKMAYLKAHYPKHFFKSLFSTYMSSDSKIKEYMYDSNLNNVAVLKPDINLSMEEYNIEEKGLRYPFNGIKNINTNTSRQITEKRGEEPFTDIYDFMVRAYGSTVNRRVLESLIDAGTFDSFGTNRKTLHNNIDELINYSDIATFLDKESQETLKPELKQSNEFSNKELLERELNVFGIYLGNHPITIIKENNSLKTRITDLSKHVNKIVNIILYVDKLKEIETKKKEKMLFLTCSDELNVIDIILFPSIYQRYNAFTIGSVIKINGKIEERDGKIQIVANTIEKLG